MKLKPISEQVVVITGASSGIGRLACIEFARLGAKVVAVARSEPGLLSLIREIEGQGGEATYIIADVAEYNQLKRAADHCIEVHGRIDTWINNAGIGIWALHDQVTPQEYKRIMEVNYLGQVHGALLALPHLKKSGGALIHVTSVESYVPLPYNVPYAATKYAVRGFVEGLRTEMSKEYPNVTITNVMPASINTPIFNKSRSKIGVLPRGIPPYYNPDSVVKTLIYAATHPSADLVSGTIGLSMVWLAKISPSIPSWLLNSFGGYGFKKMKSEKPRNPMEPDNFDECLPNGLHDAIFGEYSEEAKISLLDIFRSSTAAKVSMYSAIVASAVAAGSLIVTRNMKKE